MKIAVAGKGGVGKTTISSMLARHFAAQATGKEVIAVDADPSMNMAFSLGFTESEKSQVTPLSEMKELIEERTGAKIGQSGSYFILNPKVDDLTDKIGVVKNNVRLVIMGTVEKGGGGCICPQSAILKAFLNHLFIKREEVLIVDMEAGVEHLGRSIAQNMDALLLIAEPTAQSVDVVKQAADLAKDLGIENIMLVGNKIEDEQDKEFLRNAMPGVQVAGFLPYSKAFRNLYQNPDGLQSLPEEFAKSATQIIENLTSMKIEEEA